MSCMICGPLPKITIGDQTCITSAMLPTNHAKSIPLEDSGTCDAGVDVDWLPKLVPFFRKNTQLRRRLRAFCLRWLESNINLKPPVKVKVVGKRQPSVTATMNAANTAAAKGHESFRDVCLWLCRFLGQSRPAAPVASLPELCTDLRANKFSNVADLLHCVCARETPLREAVLVMRLLIVLSTAEPVMQFLRSPATTALVAVMDDATQLMIPANRDVLQRVPLVLSLLQQVQMKCKPELYKVLRDVCILSDGNLRSFHTQRAKYPALSVPQVVTACDTVIDVPDFAVMNPDEFRGRLTKSSISGAPRIRGRPHYLADEKEEEEDEDGDDGEGDRCNHNFPEWKKRMSGWYTWTCPHRVCTEVAMCEKAETRNSYFTSIVERYPIAPTAIVCDMGCVQMKYDMRREPFFFLKTQYCVDAAHVTGHVACSECCDIRPYQTSGVDDFATPNGSACEELHAQLRRLETTLGWMHANSCDGHALLFMRIFIDCLNRDTNRKLGDRLNNAHNRSM